MSTQAQITESLFLASKLNNILQGVLNKVIKVSRIVVVAMPFEEVQSCPVYYEKVDIKFLCKLL
jgi:hypothetical protein